MSKNVNRLLNIFSVISVIVLIATAFRTLIYWFIGIDNARVFRTELFIIWGICITVLLLNFFQNKQKRN
ncbi:hypothetical protein ACFQ1Q_01250 [Winogradskyella litorisediminis]|uniref:Uncharacterized protein n=1 Tax=Winogradskyella litorisediminis TaxID=1156618 RepID=A0ABW3N2B4_9FLAO